MHIFYSDHFVLPLPEGHRFPMEKYSLLRERVIQAGLSGDQALHEARAATDEEILRAHDADYLHKVIDGTLTPAETRRIGFPWTPKMVERSRRSAGADPYQDDRLGRLALSKEGLRGRDRMVLEYCHAAGVAVAIVMAGGYSRNTSDTVDIHFSTVQTAAQFHRAAWPPASRQAKRPR